MERLRVHYWDKDGEPKEAIVEAEDGEAAFQSIEDLGRRGYVESAPAKRRRSRTPKEEG